jgi:glutamine synthetase
MKPREVKTAAEARRIVEQRDLTHVKIGVADLDGVLRGKYVAREKFFSGLENGLGFCDVILGWDVDDQAYDNVQFTGWHTGFPDAKVSVVPETCRELPLEPGMVFFLCEFEGSAAELCPRGLLKRTIDRANKLGYSPYASLEYEFFVFEETPHSVREKGYKDLKPLTPGSFGYSVLRSTVGADFYRALLSLCEEMDMPLEGLHTETGPGVLEAAITVDGALAAADKAVLFKTFVKALAQRHGLMATFMAKWSHQQAGQSGHIHLSLKDGAGESTFYAEHAPHGISPTMRHFIGGQKQLMPELLAMVGSTVNSYSRMVPGLWAPTRSNWGIENRTCAIRAIPGSAKSQRVEYRVAASDANPYLGLAAALGSGLWGIENEIDPGEPITGNAYTADPEGSTPLPGTLWEAAQRFKSSAAGRELFWDHFVDHYAASREWEERAFRKHVTDWELARYFEII